METIYLDNNATTRVAPEVFEAMIPYFRDVFGNPSSAHSFGGQVRQRIDKAREQVANLIGAEPREIIFTSGGTESDNTAIRSALAARPDKKHILVSRVEHPAIHSLCRYLGRKGYRVTEVPVDEHGQLDMDAYKKSLSDDTAIVSLMWANNETGVIFSVEETAELAHNKGIPFHTDAVQAAGKIKIDLNNTVIDMLSLSGHKFHGPKGIGALYVRRGTFFKPLIIGGHQEFNRRAGTENVPAIIGLGKACDLAAQYPEEEKTRVRALRDKLEKGIIETVRQVRVNGIGTLRLPNTSNISFEYIEGESILLLLNEYGISVSTGSACSSGSLEPSHVLLAMGLTPTSAQGAIRFSLGIYNRDSDVETVLEYIPGIIEGLRRMSPIWTEDRMHGK